MLLPGSDQDVEGDNNQQNSAQKHPRSSPTQRTPHRQQKRIPLRELTTDDDDDAGSRLLPLRLTYETENVSVESHNHPTKSKEVWSDCELKSLTEFVLFHTSGDSWPSHKLKAFWNSASPWVI